MKLKRGIFNHVQEKLKLKLEMSLIRNTKQIET